MVSPRQQWGLTLPFDSAIRSKMNLEPGMVETSRMPQFIAFLLSAIISSVPHLGFQELFGHWSIAPELGLVVFWWTALILLTACMITLTTIGKWTCFLLIVAGFSSAHAIGNLLSLGYWAPPDLHFRFFVGSIMHSSMAAGVGVIFGWLLRKAGKSSL